MFQQESGAKETYAVPWAYRHLPYLKRDTHTPYAQQDIKEVKDDLQRVFYQVMQSVSTENPTYGGERLFDYRDLPGLDSKHRIFPQGVAPLLRDLYYAMSEYCNISYAEGYRDGSNLINRLASGQITADEVSERTIRGRH